MSLNIDRIPACLRLETTTIRGTREKERILYKLNVKRERDASITVDHR